MSLQEIEAKYKGRTIRHKTREIEMMVAWAYFGMGSFNVILKHPHRAGILMGFPGSISLSELESDWEVNCADSTGT